MVAGACFLWDYKLGFESTKYYTAAAVALYTILNGALTLWIWGVEKGNIYVGTSPSGEKVCRPQGPSCACLQPPDSLALLFPEQSPAAAKTLLLDFDLFCHKEECSDIQPHRNYHTQELSQVGDNQDLPPVHRVVRRGRPLHRGSVSDDSRDFRVYNWEGGRQEVCEGRGRSRGGSGPEVQRRDARYAGWFHIWRRGRKFDWELKWQEGREAAEGLVGPVPPLRVWSEPLDWDHIRF